MPQTPPINPLGEYVRARRSELGLSRDRVAILAHSRARVVLTRGAVAHLETSPTLCRVSPEVLRGLAVALEVPTDRLLELAGYVEPARAQP